VLPFALALVLPVVPPLKFTAEIVGAWPLPYQAVRVRLTVENTGRAPISIYPLEIGTEVWTTGRNGAGPARGVPPFGGTFVLPPFDCGPHVLASSVFLRPGQRHTLTGAAAVSVRDEKEWRAGPSVTAVPLFPEPGIYTLRVHYWCVRQPKPGEFDRLATDLKVEVRKPAELDKAWVEALARDEGLVRVLLRPDAPCSDECAAVLGRLIEKAPDSTYADYGRLVVARHHLRAGARARGVAVLEKMTGRKESSGFALLPDAWLELRGADAEQKGDITRRLNRDFPDALEWLLVASKPMQRRDWQEFRKPLPPRAISK
jgi:hypothetical protein